MTADDGRGSLRDHLPEMDPPPDLAKRVKATLGARDLVRPHHVERAGVDEVGARPARRGTRWAIGAGLVAAGFVIGLFSARALDRPSNRPPTSGPNQYVFLLYGDPPDDTGAVHVAREHEYGRWASTLTGGVRWVGGHELADVVARLDSSGSAPTPSGDRLAGYFVIEAPSRERATEVARSCPHLKHGGRVVVMAITS